MDIDKNRVSLRVWGELACFTRPEMKGERVSYDVITPSACRGILEAIYWKPEIAWVIDRIHVLKPIQFANIRRNELGSVGPSERTIKGFLEGKKTGMLAQVIEEERQLRASLMLKDVDYLIEAHYLVKGGNDGPQKHYEMFRRRASKGQYFHHPYLGCRELIADFAWHEGAPPTPPESFRGEKDLGFMLHDIDFQAEMTPRFFRCLVKDGIIDVPSFDSDEVRS